MPQFSVNHLECIRHNNILFSNLNFNMKDGDLLQINGENGSGKSSLLQICSGLAEPSDGAVLWNDGNIRKYRYDFQKNMLYLGHKNAIKESLTVKENMEIIFTLAGMEKKEEFSKILKIIGLPNITNLFARNLSAGQQRRLSLTRLLMTRSKLWLLDEPFNTLDKHGKKMIEKIIFDHCNLGGIVIFTTHQEIEFNEYPIKNIHLGNKNV